MLNSQMVRPILLGLNFREYHHKIWPEIWNIPPFQDPGIPIDHTLIIMFKSHFKTTASAERLYMVTLGVRTTSEASRIHLHGSSRMWVWLVGSNGAAPPRWRITLLCGQCLWGQNPLHGSQCHELVGGLDLFFHSSIYWEWEYQLTNSYFSEEWLNHQPVNHPQVTTIGLWHSGIRRMR